MYREGLVANENIEVGFIKSKHKKEVIIVRAAGHRLTARLPLRGADSGSC
jgi:hypothetical protein